MHNLLMRIHAETLRLNLHRVRATFESLPGLPEDLRKVHEALDNIRDGARRVAKDLGDLRTRISDADAGELEPGSVRSPVSTSQEGAEIIGDKSQQARKQLQAIESNSFVVRMKSIGQDIATGLNVQTQNLIRKVNNIERSIDNPVQQGTTWHQLSEARREASGKVFNESIELLGGIALRNTRLDDNICELADALITSIFRAERQTAHAIPGTVAIMTMTFERIIRLPFPEWSIWALPLAAHEFWHVVLKKELKALDRIALATEELLGLLGQDGTDRCLGDIFATYTLGPAYAYAAITLLFDPTRVEDEARVQAICKTLSAMAPDSAQAPGTSYANVAIQLGTEWEAARTAAFAALAQDVSTLETHLKALRDLNPCPNKPAGQNYQEKIDELRQLWNPAAAEPEAPTGRVDVEHISALVTALCTALSRRSIPSFTLAEWLPLQNWAQHLMRGTSGTLDTTGCDIRHALNAAWLARVDAKRSSDKDLSTSALELGKRIYQNTRPTLVGRMPGSPS